MSAYTVHRQHFDSIPLAVIRRNVRAADLARVVPECCGLVWNAVRAQQTPAGRHVAIYLDDRINVEIGVELQGRFLNDGEVIASSSPSGEVATTTHFGPYGGLRAAHEAVHAWCRDQGHTLAGPRWEIYGHWQSAWDADPSRIRTDVYYLLKPASA